MNGTLPGIEYEYVNPMFPVRPDGIGLTPEVLKMWIMFITREKRDNGWCGDR